MAFMRGLWGFIVGVKDALVLLFLLLFFGLLWALLSARTSATMVPSGTALVIPMEGVLVDQQSNRNPLDSLIGTPRLAEMELRQVVKAIDTARDDSSVKALVLDLDRFMGGGGASLQGVAQAMTRFRASGKPIISYATAYTDDSYYLAAHASQAWLNPLGQVLVAGPGGTGLYFKTLLDKLKIDVEVFRVGTYKSFVEPFTLTEASAPAKAAEQALADSLWGSYVADVAATRKTADGKGLNMRALVADWPARVAAAGGDGGRAALSAGLVDKLGDELAVAKSLRALVGDGDDADDPTAFNAIAMGDYLRARAPLAESGGGVGVVYVSGSIVDGDADAGQAGGDTIARLVNEAVANDDVRALVVRVDSPGGSVGASEKIRAALANAKAGGLPVVASFGSVAASAGYWVATAADAIYAQPTTVTGSIGVFGIIPTFARSLKELGIGTDGVATTPLSGQPDVVGGLNAPTRALIQGGVANAYQRFVALVAAARKLPPAQVEQVAEGRVWSGRDALDRKLVDKFGDLDAAVRDAARRAGLPADARMIVIEAKPSPLLQLLGRLSGGGGEQSMGRDALARVVTISRLRAAAQVAGALEVARGTSIQASCFACAAYAPPRVTTVAAEATAAGAMTGWPARLAALLTN